MAEALAAEKGARLARQFVTNSPVLETDSLTLKSRRSEAGSNQTELGILCRNITSILGEIGNGAWCFTPREGNMVAHIMTHLETR
ncbi:unnamed protein product [Linum trigynum]|uniref:RNase H type-1 domain-containing protein n=1 Tax=Linum trigynum TaxID=586398 RepID=A0AAV2EWA0_9ROSI